MKSEKKTTLVSIAEDGSGVHEEDASNSRLEQEDSKQALKINSDRIISSNAASSDLTVQKEGCQKSSNGESKRTAEPEESKTHDPGQGMRQKRTRQRKRKEKESVFSLSKPKRPRTAYNFFVREERPKIVKLLNENESNEHSKISGKGGVSFESIGKVLGQRWNTLDPHIKAKYEALASEDTNRYTEETKNFYTRMYLHPDIKDVQDSTSSIEFQLTNPTDEKTPSTTTSLHASTNTDQQTFPSAVAEQYLNHVSNMVSSHDTSQPLAPSSSAALVQGQAKAQLPPQAKAQLPPQQVQQSFQAQSQDPILVSSFQPHSSIYAQAPFYQQTQLAHNNLQSPLAFDMGNFLTQYAGFLNNPQNLMNSLNQFQGVLTQYSVPSQSYSIDTAQHPSTVNPPAADQPTEANNTAPIAQQILANPAPLPFGNSANPPPSFGLNFPQSQQQGAAPVNSGDAFLYVPS